MYVRSVDKLKEADIKSSEVESKLEALQSENARLKKELGSRAVPANKTCELRDGNINIFLLNTYIHTYMQHTHTAFVM